ncbi:Retrovirus-related Pol polyprotein from transposon TNT 1-94 [Abeliophyllum distichum]|uniref:Retrovirus-related Pol polyprotein from transposon TNT 1-94 n=1 Tax=Abeliophyllum distichum TaxID=126358 RepID=A0ABD1QHB8_9LAMI
MFSWDMEKTQKGIDFRVKEERGFKVVIKRDVVFNESLMPCLKETTSNLKERDIRIEVESSSLENTEDMGERENLNHQEITLQNDEESTDENADSATLPIDAYQLTRDRQRRQIQPPARFNDDNFVSFLTYQEVIENEPLSLL